MGGPSVRWDTFVEMTEHDPSEQSRAPTVLGNLRHELSPFVGRAGELADLVGILSSRRLLTLTGAGGCGKTRLARRLVESAVGPWEDGVWWVDLGSVTDAEMVVTSVAETLGVWVEPDDGLDRLVRHMRDRSLLICLDTCEHLIGSAADLAERIAATAPRVGIVATSREPLGVPGETVYRVPPLTLDESVQLFLDRASRGDPTFDLNPFTDEIEHICLRLEGMPLGIELAAGWVPSLTPHQVALGLDNSLRLLGGGPRRAIPRHQALRASMDWSHDLLEPREKEVVRGLAVFAGSFTEEAADAILASREEAGGDGLEGEVIAVLRQLVDKSLVVLVPDGVRVRYRLLDTVRQYAESKLRDASEIETIRDRHLDYYASLAGEAIAQLDRDQDLVRETLDRERENLHAALSWGLSANRSAAGCSGELAAALARQWFIRGQAHEGLFFLHRAIELNRTDPALLAKLHSGLAMLAIVAGQAGQIQDHVERALELSIEVEDQVTQARTLALSSYPLFFIDAEACATKAREAEQLAGNVGEEFGRDFAACVAGYSFISRDRHDEALRLSQPAYQRSIERSDRFCAGLAQGVEQYAQMFCGDVTQAVLTGHNMLAMIEPLGNHYLRGTLAANVALALGMSGDLVSGHRLMEPVVDAIDELPDVDAVAYMYTCGQLSLWEGDLVQAQAWLERGLRQRGTFAWSAIRCLMPMAAVMRGLGRNEEALALAVEAETAARSCDAPQVLAEAWDEQARLAAERDPAHAYDLRHRALALKRQYGLRSFYVDSLDGLAASALLAQRHAIAARLLAASDAARGELGYPRPRAGQAVHERLLAAVRSGLGEEPFEVAWGEGASWSLEEAVAVATRGRGAHTRPISGWSSLTPTEREVVGLVVEGLTNPEIGQRLFMGRSTVKTHLSHIYAKVGISNRAGLAALAAARRIEGQE